MTVNRRISFCHRPASLLLAACLHAVLHCNGNAQMPGLGKATQFKTDEYFEPPNDLKVKMELEGDSATPLPGGNLDISNLTIQTYRLDGGTDALIQAPDCIYAPYDGLAYSSGPIQMKTADNRLYVTGRGFLWQQADNSLTISNQVYTLVKMKTLSDHKP